MVAPELDEPRAQWQSLRLPASPAASAATTSSAATTEPTAATAARRGEGCSAGRRKVMHGAGEVDGIERWATPHIPVRLLLVVQVSELLGPLALNAKQHGIGQQTFVEFDQLRGVVDIDFLGQLAVGTLQRLDPIGFGQLHIVAQAIQIITQVYAFFGAGWHE